jgi:hypothetical protein
MMSSTRFIIFSLAIIGRSLDFVHGEFPVKAEAVQRTLKINNLSLGSDASPFPGIGLVTSAYSQCPGTVLAPPLTAGDDLPCMTSMNQETMGTIVSSTMMSSERMSVGPKSGPSLGVQTLVIAVLVCLVVF